MRVVLSRKGMDSAAGGIPSPIMPDKTLLSLPIPDHSGCEGKYADYIYKGRSYKEIISELNPRFDFSKKSACHLDPDIYSDIIFHAYPERTPAFGQCDASASHLDKHEVDIGDLFLFYGMFRKTGYGVDGKLQYVRSAPTEHIIYGYMVIGGIIKIQSDIDQDYPWHPHSTGKSRKANRLYIPAESGTFQFDERLVLTKRGQEKRCLWELPAFFAGDDIKISWQGKKKPILNGNRATLSSSPRGQEFVIEASSPAAEQQLAEWAYTLIHH